MNCSHLTCGEKATHRLVITGRDWKGTDMYVCERHRNVENVRLRAFARDLGVAEIEFYEENLNPYDPPV